MVGDHVIGDVEAYFHRELQRALSGALRLPVGEIGVPSDGDNLSKLT